MFTVKIQQQQQKNNQLVHASFPTHERVLLLRAHDQHVFGVCWQVWLTIIFKSKEEKLRALYCWASRAGEKACSQPASHEGDLHSPGKTKL